MGFFTNLVQLLSCFGKPKSERASEDSSEYPIRPIRDYRDTLDVRVKGRMSPHLHHAKQPHKWKRRPRQHYPVLKQKPVYLEDEDCDIDLWFEYKMRMEKARKK